MIVDKIQGMFGKTKEKEQIDTPIIDRSEVDGRKNLAEEKRRVIQPDTDLLHMINYIRKGEGPYIYSSYYKIEKYPNTVSGFWLDDLISVMPNIKLNIEIIPIDRDIATEKFKKNIKAYERAASIDEERGYEDMKLREVLDENKAVLDSIKKNALFNVCVNIGIEVIIDDKEEIAKIKKGDEKSAIETLVREREKLYDTIRQSPGLGRECKVVELVFSQAAGVVATTPVHINQRPTFKEMLSPSVIGMFPFTSEIANDQTGGFIMGFNKYTLDPFAPNVDNLYRRKKIGNVHMTIFGAAGFGKSTAINRLITYSMPDSFQLVIDFARDYGMTATLFKENAHIKRYSLKPAKEGGFIPDDNFFEVPRKYDGTSLYSSEEYIANVLLPCFDKIYSDIGDNINKRAIMSEAFTAIYYKDKTGLSLSIQDLKQQLTMMLNQAEMDKKDNVDEYRTLINGLEPAFSGVYKNIFTRTGESIRTTKNLVVVDMFDLKGSSDAGCSPIGQFVLVYNFLVYKEKMAKERDPFGRKKRIIIDEAHRVTDSKAILGMFSTAYKEIRGEGVQMVLSTQTVDDILKDKESREILNNSGLTVFFGQKPNAIKTIQDNLPGKFSERSLAFLRKESVGEAVITIGEKDFICTLINDQFLNNDLFKKDVLTKVSYGQDGYFNLEQIDRDFAGIYSAYKIRLEEGVKQMEKMNSGK